MIVISLHTIMLFLLNESATNVIYTLSLHDALPISQFAAVEAPAPILERLIETIEYEKRSEEHTSELQSRRDLVCRLLLEKKKYIPLRKRHVTRTTHAYII